VIPFLDALAERVLVCDGAMGTMLYAQGVFVNRSFDSLNLDDPQQVLDLHRAYVRAGADVLETNTFGANRVKLRAFGLADRLRDVNRAGAELARRAAGDGVYVAGAIGPLGLRIEPWGRTGRVEAEAWFREQAEALLDGGVDLFVLETFRDVHEACAAIGGVRSVSDRPIVAQMTVEDDGASLDGTPPEQFAPALREAGADVIGLNCSIGPAHMLEALERLAAAAGGPLAAQPNAGRPRDIEGRTLYLTSPDYMASYARRFAGAGVRLVGGCCGTTPGHIARMAAAVRPQAPPPLPVAVAGYASGGEAAAPASSAPPASTLATALAAGRPVTLMEVVPGKGASSASVLADVGSLHERGVGFAYVTDGPQGPRPSALTVAALIEQRTAVEVVLAYAARERPLLAMQSELLGAHALGVRNVVAVTGDVRADGDYSDATAVVDVDAIGLLAAVGQLNRGIDIGGQDIGSRTAFHPGATANPAAEDLERERRRLERKVEAGAAFIIVRPVFDVATAERMWRALEATRLPLVLGLRPLAGLAEAEYLANEAPGVCVPDAVLDRLRAAGTPEAEAAEGILVAAEVGRALRGAVAGVLVSPGAATVARGLAVLEAMA